MFGVVATRAGHTDHAASRHCVGSALNVRMEARVAGPGRWNQSAPSEFPWEQDALDHISQLMPDTEPYRAWAIFAFTAETGHVRDVDLLIAVGSASQTAPGRSATAW